MTAGISLWSRASTARLRVSFCRAFPDTLSGYAWIVLHFFMQGMMKGNGANCLRIIPNSAVKFFTYEHLSRQDQALRTWALHHCSEALPNVHLLAPQGDS